MSTERPTFEANKLMEPPLVLPESFMDALKAQRPDGLNWDRIDGAIAVLKGEKDAVAPKPPDVVTESQKFWRKMLENGDQPLYDKNKGPVKFAAVKEVFNKFRSKSIGEHIMAIDKDFRGGRDAGGIKERAQRVAVLMGIAGGFTFFDYITTKPFEGRFPVNKADSSTLSADVLKLNSRNGAIMTLIDVLNDKYASALGNMLAEKLTGKRGFIHEVADKGADTVQVGFTKTKDLMNGATLESYLRILSQVPIAGALLEQAFVRLSLFQESSPLHTATGKMVYMALGVYTKFARAAAGKERPVTASDITEAMIR